MKGTSPTISALGAYSPPAASSTPHCGKCGEYVVIKADAIGRLVERCPRCDRLAPTRKPHPDEVLVPQTLVRASQLLPEIEPGQLRCQVCARGLQGNARFHAECRRLRKQDQLAESRDRHAAPWMCRRCGASIPRKRGRPPKLCERCR